MCDTLSKFIGTALISLGDFARFVSDNELQKVAYDRLAFYLEDLRESDQNQKIKRLEFTLPSNTNEVDLKALADDIFTVAWVEVRLDHNQNFQQWRFVPTVNLDAIEDYADRGEIACAFYGEDVDALKIVFSYYGAENGFSQHRLRYDPNITLPDLLTDTVKLPNNLANVITHDITSELIPYVKLRMIDQVTEETAPMMNMKLAALEQIRNDATARKMEWLDKWKNYKHNANRSQRGMKLPKYFGNRFF
jgi:hypothetical protein